MKKKSKFKMEYRAISIIKPLAEKAEDAIKSGKHGYQNLPDLMSALLREWLKEKGYLQ